MCKDKAISIGLLVIVMWLILTLDRDREGMDGNLSNADGSNVNVVNGSNVNDVNGSNVNDVNGSNVNGSNKFPKSVGKYGDVDVWVYETKDNKTASEWREVDGGIYLHNSKTWWKDQHDTSDYVKGTTEGFIAALRPENDFH